MVGGMVRLEEAKAGVLVLNKPAGMTSQQAVTRVRRLLGFSKAGHSGILDPDVTGVLPVLFGTATRLAEYITDAHKTYEATVVFGSATDTQDATGEVVAKGDPHSLDETVIDAALQQFVGVIQQLPPQYSALKIAGKRAYEYARQGQVAPLVARSVQVLSCQLLGVVHGADTVQARFVITCSKGTYVRTICHDLGCMLGVPAHMGTLIRTHSGPFTLADAHTFAELESRGRQLVLLPQAAVPHLPVVSATSAQGQRVFHGAPFWVQVADDLALGQDVQVHSLDGQLLAIYSVSQLQVGEGALLTAKKVLALQEVTA